MSEEKKKWFFVSSYCSMILVVQPADWVAVEGRAVRVRPVRIEFLKRPHPARPRDPNVNPYRGEFATSDPALADFIRKHPFFRDETYDFNCHVNSRGIWELPGDPDAAPREAKS